MAQIRTKLKQLRDADVRYISLVDRAATRIPFRVLKRDKETQMIDLTSVFKSDDGGAKPSVSALVVFAQKDAAVATQIRDAIKAQGFSVDRVQKSDAGETLVYAQKDQSKDVQVVRLSDQLLVSVANLQKPAGWVGDMVEQHGFFPDMPLATAELQDQLQEVALKSEQPQVDAEAVLTSYAQYVSQMTTLPTACFKLEEAVAEIVAKCSCEDEKAVEEVEEVEKAGEKPGETGAKNPASEAIKNQSEYDNKKRGKTTHSPAEMAPKDEEDDQKPPPDSDFVTGQKSDIATALKGITAQLAGLSTKLDTVVADQSAQKKVLDEVVTKADTLTSTLNATVTAPPLDGDRPSARGDVRMRVQKDDDPRTGNFDTAFLRKRK